MLKFEWNKPYPPVIVNSTNVQLYADLDEDFDFLNKICVIRKNADANYDRLWNMFPGVYCDHEAYFNLYQPFYNKEFTSGNYPRGNLNSRIVVVGLAPGYVDREFKEPMWLLGPSSKLLRDSLTKSVYFTNVKWESFKNNYFDAEYDFSSDIERLTREISILSPNIVIFLGKYPVYNEIFLDSQIQRHSVYHPSYLLRKPNELVRQRWFETISKNIGMKNIQFESSLDLSMFDFDNSIFRDSDYKTSRDEANLKK